MDLAARWHSESSRTREWTHVPIWQADSYPLDHQGSPNFIFLHVDYPATAAPFVKKIILSPLNGLGTLVKNQLTMWVNFWTQFYSIDWEVSPEASITLSWLLQVCGKFSNREESSNSVLFQDCFGCSGSFEFPYGFQDQLVNLLQISQLGSWQGLCWIYRSIWGFWLY